MNLWLSTVVLYTDQNSFGLGDRLLKMKETTKAGFNSQLRKENTKTGRALTLKLQNYSYFTKVLSRICCSSQLELIQ